MTVLYETTVEVPMFINPGWDLSMAVKAGMRVTRVQPDDEVHAIFERVKKNTVDGWPVKVFTVKIVRGEDCEI